jgi:serine/threonine protein kinase/formylglycine-generating enzyme required for sulfatase activity/uncharacterized coiled-coil protein SlyX
LTDQHDNRLSEAPTWHLQPDQLINELQGSTWAHRAAPRIPGYEDLRELGCGGQGVVYEATQTSAGRRVAIKVLHRGSWSHDAQRRRFEREIALIVRLQHPNIVTLYDSGLTEDSQPYYVMEYVDGAPLDAHPTFARALAAVPSRDPQRARDRALEVRGETGDGLDLREMLQLFCKICDAVNAAHLKGVIHRDLKPGNIIVDAASEPHVVDFGLAKSVASEEVASLTQMSVSGQFMGSLPWASPEQVAGHPDAIDVRTDVYSLGVILYQLLTARFPYEAPQGLHELVNHIKHTEPARPRSLCAHVDDEIETIVLKCLAKEPERRYQTAGELSRDIQRYLRGEPIEAKRDSATYLLRKQLRRYRLPLAVALAFVLVLASGLIVSVSFWRRAVAQRDAAEAARRAEADAREAEEAQRMLAEQRYDEIIRLADLKRLADAEAAANELWPAHPDKIKAMEAWLEQQAAPLRDNLPVHERTLQSLRARALDYDAKQQRHDRKTHPRAAELGKQEGILAEFRSLLEEARAAREAVDRTEADLAIAEPKDGAGADESARAAALAARIVELEQKITEREQSISELQETVKERRTWRFSDDQVQWQHDTLAGLVTDLETFVDPDPKKGTLASVKERLAFANSIEQRSITGPQAAAKWAEAIADIGKLEVYGGLQINPQVGLMPLRRDPRSGLWEFWHIQTGTQPEPNPDDEAANPWILTGDTGLVFVLIPGGTFWMGAQKEDPEGHNYDPQAESNESPVHEVTLAAFFMSKYEMTQGQWQRFTDENPSSYGPNWSWKGEPPADEPIHQNRPWNPVEQVSWIECQDVLTRLGLVLPTEAQWEHAARAGSNTVWWTGNEKESIGLMRAGNLADGWTKRMGGPASWRYEDWLEDGWIIHAPVGSFSPNAFGLHDVIGNVGEWCRDGYAYYDRDVEPGDGLRRVFVARDRVTRDGGNRRPAVFARSANRHHAAPETRFLDLGVRPARAVTE